MAIDAFDLAERFQTPVFVMTDLDLGMNNWMADPFPYPEKPLDRGKVLRTKEEFEEHVAKFKEFARYRDVDGDGIPYRTLPGLHRHPGARRTSRAAPATTSARTYTERPDDYKNNMDRLARKFETAKTYVPKPAVSNGSGATRRASSPTAPRTSPSRRRGVLLARKGLETDYLRLRALPFTPETAAFVAAHERVYVVDQNRDGQMYDLLRLEVRRRRARSCARSATTTASPSTPRR